MMRKSNPALAILLAGAMTAAVGAVVVLAIELQGIFI